MNKLFLLVGVLALTACKSQEKVVKTKMFVDTTYAAINDKGEVCARLRVEPSIGDNVLCHWYPQEHGLGIR